MWILIVYALNLPIAYNSVASYTTADQCWARALPANVQLQETSASYRVDCRPASQVLNPNPDYRPGSLPRKI